MNLIKKASIFLAPILIGLIVLPLLNYILSTMGVRIVDAGPGRPYLVIELAIYALLGLVVVASFLKKNRALDAGLLFVGLLIGTGVAYVASLLAHLSATCANGC